MDANAAQEHRHSGNANTNKNEEQEEEDYSNNKEFKLYKKTNNYKLFRKKEQKLFDELINSLKSIKTKAKQQQQQQLNPNNTNTNQIALTTSSTLAPNNDNTSTNKTKIKKNKKLNKKKQLNAFKEFSELLASTKQQTGSSKGVSASSLIPSISFSSADATSIKEINSNRMNKNDLIKLNKKFKTCSSNINNNNNGSSDKNVCNENDEEDLNGDDEEEISEIESFVFNDENDEELDFNNMTEAEFIKRYDINLDLINNKKQNNVNKETVMIDSDTRVKLETLLANAGIESITNDLLKDPQIMQTLTSTYVKTLNEVVSKTQQNNNNNNNNNNNKSNKTISSSDSNKSKSNIESKTVLSDVVESTFEEFILAAAAVAAATASAEKDPNFSLKSRLNLDKLDQVDLDEIDNLVVDDDEEEEEESDDNEDNDEEDEIEYDEDEDEEENDNDDDDDEDEDENYENDEIEYENEDDDNLDDVELEQDEQIDDEDMKQFQENLKRIKQKNIIEFKKKCYNDLLSNECVDNAIAKIINFDTSALSQLSKKSNTDTNKIKKTSKKQNKNSNESSSSSPSSSGQLLLNINKLNGENSNNKKNTQVKQQMVNKNSSKTIKNNMDKNGLLLFSSETNAKTDQTNESKIIDCIDNLNNPDSILSKLIEFKSANDLIYFSNDNEITSSNQSASNLDSSTTAAAEAVAAVAAKKLVVGKSLTELLEENADSVLGLACASGYIELVTVLLAINANIEDKGHKNETTPLMEACANGHKAIVQLLLKHGANVNAQSSCGNTPLHYAVQHNFIEIVELLIKESNGGLKLEIPNENGHTPLMEAASAGFVNCARLLLDVGADVNTRSNEFKETALTLASYKGHVEMVKILIERGADLEHRTDEMHTALMETCMDGHVEVARILIEHGANVNMPPDSFESPLTLAACGGHVELANLLIDHRADLEERNDEGYTPLMEAAREGHEEMVALLLFHDADINAITEETQETALTLACCGGCYEVAKFLLEAGADPNLGSASTPLMEAAQEGHLELVQLLIKAGAEVNKFTTTIVNNSNNNGNGNTNSNSNNQNNTTSCESALTLASENGHTNIVDCLIKAGAEIDKPDPEKGFTPLMKGSRSGQLCTIQYLLNNCNNQTGLPVIDVNRTTPNNEQTALSLACQNGHYQVVELLLHYGANPLHSLKDNSNCLIEAAKYGHTKIVELLIDWNYSLNINNTNSIPSDNTNAFMEPCCDEELCSHDIPFNMPSFLNDNDENEEIRVPPLDNQLATNEQIANRLKLSPFKDAKSNKIISKTQSEPPIVKQIKKSVSRLDTTSDIGLENLVNVLHHFAFGGEYQQQQNENAKLTNENGGNSLKKIKAKVRNSNAGGEEKLEDEQLESNSIDDCLDVDGNSILVEEYCECNCEKEVDEANPKVKASSSQSSLLHLSLSIGKAKNNNDGSCEHTKFSPSKPNELSYYDEKEEDKQIKRKENLLQELLKIEKQLEIQKKQSLANCNSSNSRQSPKKDDINETKTSKSLTVNNTSGNSASNYDHISMINKYLIKKCEYDLNRLYKTKLRQLQQKPIELKGNDLLTAKTNIQSSNNNNNNQVIKSAKKRLISSSSSSPSSLAKATAGDNEKLQNNDEMINKAEGEKNKILSNDDSVKASSITNTLMEFKKLSIDNIENASENKTSLTTSNSFSTIINQTNLNQNSKSTSISLSDIQPTLFFKSSNTTQNKNKNQATAPSPPPPPPSPPPSNNNYNTKSSTSKSIKTSTSKDKITKTNSLQKITNNNNQQFHACPHNHHHHNHNHHHHHSDLKHKLNTTTTTIEKNSTSPLSSSSSSSDDWLPPPPPPFAAAAAYLIQQSMKNKANQHNYPHIDLDSATESNNDTALTVAVAGGYEELVKLLIEKGAHIEHKDKKGYTPLILAASLGYQRIVQLLLIYGADVEAQSERNKDTALSAAAQAGKYECCEILLTKGQANKEHRNISDYTPLSLAASGGYVNIIKLLLSHGAEINSRTGSKLGISPLMLAAMNGHTQAVKLLIDVGADVNAQIETNRNTALTLACFQGRTDVVNLLLEKKANIEHRAKTGLTPLMEAASGGYENVGRILLEKGADVNASPVPSSKDTALIIASEKGHIKFVQLLVDYGAQLDAKNKKGCTPLWLACNNGHLEVVQTLVLHHADTDGCDSRRISCLMAAFRKGHVKICKFMVKHVRQFPSDQDCNRFINSLITANLNGISQQASTHPSDKDLIKRCQQCMDIIVQAKEKQAQEANRVANSLLKEIESEKSREQNKKAAAQRKREKRKLKKKNQNKNENEKLNDLKENADENENEVEQKSESQAKEEEEVDEPDVEHIKDIVQQKVKHESKSKKNKNKSNKPINKYAKKNEEQSDLENSDKDADNNFEVEEEIKKETNNQFIFPSQIHQQRNRKLSITSMKTNEPNNANKKPYTHTQASITNQPKQQQLSNSNVNNKNNNIKLVKPDDESNEKSQLQVPTQQPQRSKSQTMQSGSTFNQIIKNLTPGPKTQPQNAQQYTHHTNQYVQPKNITEPNLNRVQMINKKTSITNTIGVASNKMSKAQQSLADLDDFDQPSNKSNKLVKLTTTTSTTNQAQPSKDKYKQKQRIIVPHDKFLRVTGKANAKIKLVQEITGALLEIEDKKIPPNQDSSILIKGETVEITKYAFELIQTLINDPDADLNNFIISNGSKQAKKPNGQSAPLNKWASKPVNTYNPLVGGVSLIKSSDDRAELQKPRNFAEVVAKQPSNITTLSNSLSNSNTTLNKSTISVFSKNSNETKVQTANVNSLSSRRHNSVSPTTANSYSKSSQVTSTNNQSNTNLNKNGPIAKSNSQFGQSSQQTAKIVKSTEHNKFTNSSIATAKSSNVNSANITNKKLLPDLPTASKSSTTTKVNNEPIKYETIQLNNEQISPVNNKTSSNSYLGVNKLNTNKKPISVVPPYAQNSNECKTQLPQLNKIEVDFGGKLQNNARTSDQTSPFKNQLPSTDSFATDLNTNLEASSTSSLIQNNLIQSSLSNPLISKSLETNSTGSSSIISSTGSSSNVDNDLQTNNFLDLNSLGLLDGLGPLWPLSSNTNNESFMSNLENSTHNNKQTSQYLTNANPLQLQAHKLINQTSSINILSQNGIEDAKLSGTKPKEHNINQAGTSNIGNKPIGYERHEKQIHNNSNILTTSPSLNTQLSQLNNINNTQPLNDFSYFYNNSNLNFQQQQTQKPFSPNILPQMNTQVDLSQIENLITNGTNNNLLENKNDMNSIPKLPIQNANSLLAPLINNGLQAQLQNQWLNSYSSMMAIGQQNPLDLLNAFLPNALAQTPLNLLQQTVSLQSNNGALFSQFPNLIGLNQFATINNQLQQQTLIDNFKNANWNFNQFYDNQSAPMNLLQQPQQQQQPHQQHQQQHANPQSRQHQNL